jgi:hypothetical protein
MFVARGLAIACIGSVEAGDGVILR